MMGFPATNILDNEACELESYPETSSHIQRMVQKGINPCNEISSLIHCFMQDQDKARYPKYQDLIEELTFLLGFYSKKNIYQFMAA